MTDWMPGKYAKWVDLREKLSLNHTQIQMIRDLGIDASRCEQLHQNPPKGLSFDAYLSENYAKRFGSDQPEEVKSIEEIVAERQQKKALRHKMHEIKSMLGEADLGPVRLEFKVELDEETKPAEPTELPES